MLRVSSPDMAAFCAGGVVLWALSVFSGVMGSAVTYKPMLAVAVYVWFALPVGLAGLAFRRLVAGPDEGEANTSCVPR